MKHLVNPDTGDHVHASHMTANKLIAEDGYIDVGGADPGDDENAEKPASKSKSSAKKKQADPGDDENA